MINSMKLEKCANLFNVVVVWNISEMISITKIISIINALIVIMLIMSGFVYSSLPYVYG